MYKIFTKKCVGLSKPIGKMLLIMRLTILLLITGFLQLHANSYAQRISIEGKDISLEQIFKEIKKQAGYDFIYDEALLRKVDPVSVQIKDLSLKATLDRVLEGKALTYSITDKIITIQQQTMRDKITRFILQPSTLSGTVTDEKGNALVGVNIVIEGRGKGTQTGPQGQYRIVATAGDILVFSCVGYDAETLTVGKNAIVNVVLKARIEVLDAIAIVNTGYQRLSKERSAGAYAKPDMEILALRSTSMNVLQRLDGLVPGLTVNNAPLSNNPLLIRGLTTLGLDDEGTGTNRSPLVVVDGIAIDDVSSVNPQDVAEITILKDATAASIWGARASNGVVVIVTKKGRNHENLKVQYDAFMNFQGRPDLAYIPVLSSSQFIQTAKELFNPELYPWETVSAFTNTGSTGLAPHEVIMYNEYRGLISDAQANKSLDSLAAINNHQQIRDLFYRNASVMNHTLSLSGGGKVHSFYGSLAYTNTVSPRPGEQDDTYKINLRQDVTINKWLQAYLITDLTNRLTSGKRMPAIDYRFYPYQLFQDAQGNHLSTPYMGLASDAVRQDWENRSRINLDYVPLNEVNYGYTKNDDWMSRITGGLNVALWEGLSFQGVYGYVKQSGKITNYDSDQSYSVRTEQAEFTVAPTAGSQPVYYLPMTGGRYGVNHVDHRAWTIRNQLLYDQSWNDQLHQVSLLVGQEAQSQRTIHNNSLVLGYDEALQTYGVIDYHTLSTTGITSPVIPNNLGRSIFFQRPFTQTEGEIRFTSYYANGGYTYNRKYTLNASWRIDHSNLFGLDKSAQNRPVWSAGVKWNVMEEPFTEGWERLTALALRATYGVTGNSPLPGTASSYDVLSANNSGFLPGGKGLTVATAANPKLTWESTSILNIGIDFGILNARLRGSVDWYDKKTDNLLGMMTVNGFTGYSSIVGNFGSLQNTGLEFSLQSLNVRSGNFSWRTHLNLAYNKNTITQLNDPVAITTGAQKVRANYLTGYPAFAIFAYEYAGLDHMGDPQIQLADGSVTKNRNVATPDDIVFKGTYQPVWSGGLSNSFQYRQFTLMANAILNLGHVMRRDVGPNQTLGGSYTGRLISHNNILSQSSQSGFTGGTLHPDFLDRWKKPGDEAITNVPAYVADQSESETRRDIEYYRRGDINVVSASYVKLRDITLQYNLPETISQRIRVARVSLRLQLSNIMLWKANKYDIDPEFHYAPSGLRAPSAPYITNPAVNATNYRYGQGTWTFGVNVNF